MTTASHNYLLNLKKAKSSYEMSRALENFYNETSHLVYRYCRKKIISAADSDDIVQIVYTQIFKKRHLYNEAHSPLAWLYVVTRSETKDYIKKQAIYTGYVNDYRDFATLSQSDHDNPNSQQKELDLDLQNRIKQNLNETEKSVIEKRYFEERSFEEISEELNLTLVNLRKIVSRSLKKLKK